ncbi:hypothetical protein MRX96_054822 [Rhipicephalus microplus]
MIKFPGGNFPPDSDALVRHGMTCGALTVSKQLGYFYFLKELSFTLFSLDSGTWVPFFQYIATASTLRKLEIDLLLLHPAPDLKVVFWWRSLSKSLRRNGSIVELGVGAKNDGSGTVQSVGEEVARHPTIRKLHLLPLDKNELAAFLRGLRANISDNYALCSALFKRKPILADMAAAWFEVSDAARCNYGLVDRAAHFLKDVRSDGLCASALERVSAHPGLVAALVEVLRIGEAEAASAVRQRLGESEVFTPSCDWLASSETGSGASKTAARSWMPSTGAAGCT